MLIANHVAGEIDIAKKYSKNGISVKRNFKNYSFANTSRKHSIFAKKVYTLRYF